MPTASAPAALIAAFGLFLGLIPLNLSGQTPVRVPLTASVQTVDNTAFLTGTFTVPKPARRTDYALQVSHDLVTWQTHRFRYDPESDQIRTSPETPLTLQRLDSADEDVLAGAVTIPPGAASFLKFGNATGPLSADLTLTEETRNLLANLHRIGWDPDRFAFGQEFPLSYGEGDNTGNGDIEQSDCKDMVGDHPGVHGSDFDYMLDRPWEEDFHIAAARKAYQDGAIVTFDWHWGGKNSGGYQAHPDDNRILDHVVRNDDSRGDVAWFYGEIDRVLDRINNDLQIPIVFRPFHEMDGNWFWWGRQIDGGAATYRRAYQLLVEYMSERTDYVLFCWSPDVALADFEQFYPGDEYVDVCGRDIYSIGNSGRPLTKLTEMIDFAADRGKVAAFTETGYTAGGNSFETGDPDWWTTRILQPITDDAKAGQIAWVLTWINAEWSGPYIPHANSPQAAKDDFTAFYESPATLFQEEISSLKVYDPPPAD